MSLLTSFTTKIVTNPQFASVLTLERNGSRYYRITDISSRLGYQSSLSVAKLRNEYHCSLFKFDDLEPNKLRQKNLFRESSAYTSSNLCAASQFTDENGFKTIVRNSKRKPAAITAAIELNMLGAEAGERCIQAKIEHLLIPYFKHWGICIEHEKTMKVGGHHFRVDMHLPQFKIAIEIDERGHVDRDAAYENRRQTLLEGIGYRFVRLNPHAIKRPLNLIVACFWRTKLFPILKQQKGDLVMANRVISEADAAPIVISEKDSIECSKTEPENAQIEIKPRTSIQVMYVLTNLHVWYTIAQVCILYYLLRLT